MRTSEQALAALRCTRIVHAYPDFLMSCRATFTLAAFMGIACRLLPLLYLPDHYRDAGAAVAMSGFEYLATRFESGFLRIDQRDLETLYPVFDNPRHHRRQAIQPR